MIQPSTLYSNQFFDTIEQGAVGSARVVLPILLGLVRPARVVDIGCGRGAWLRVLQELGVPHIHGFDGAYVESEKMLIDRSHFSPVDLSGSFEIKDHYDLAICLEVVEHLPDEAGRRIVRQLTGCAPLVLFSAAIPGQLGQHHVNCQWPSYWQSLFAEQGFQLVDPIRRQVRDDARVEWWYRQNIVLYVSPQSFHESPALCAEKELATGPVLEWIHHDVLTDSLTIASERKLDIRRPLRRLRRKLGIRQFLRQLIGR